MTFPDQNKNYARVILPLKLRGGQVYTYHIPECFRGQVETGSRVTVQVITAKYQGIVSEFTDTPDIDTSRIRPILSVEPFQKIRKTELALWHQMADYYMCSIGEVYAAACPASLKPLRGRKKDAETDSERAADASESPDSGNSVRNVQEDGDSPDSAEPASGEAPLTINRFKQTNPLSEAQTEALKSIVDSFSLHKTVLLNGVTGSGKTEIYVHLIKECLEGGKNALYMIPEKTVSRQLTNRLKKVFGDSVLVFHSGVSAAKRKEIRKILAEDGQPPKLVIGLRSAVFLPFENLGLVIIDEEHDSSYKQYDPAPRYNGRDAALMLARIHGADVLLGSATPSFESMYNVTRGRFVQVLLDRKFNDAPEATVTVVDMRKKRRERAVCGSISFTLREAIKKRLEAGEQTLVFRSRRAYATAMVCDSCGDIPHCPHCNASLTYHKFSNSLRCHYCGYTFRLGPQMSCPSCREGTLAPVGAGTEKIEEELIAMFPEARVARLDADTAEGKEGREILKSFAEGNIDILVGTQMVSKGIDIPGLTLAAVIQGESLFAVNDFRADEKALQLLTQLRGRVGRRSRQGEIIIQTALPSHPVFRLDDIAGLLDERRMFRFPPFFRIMEITVRNRSMLRLQQDAAVIKKILDDSGINDFDGPVPGIMERKQDEHIMKFTLRMTRTRDAEIKKTKLKESLLLLEADITVNVDPL